MEGGGTKPHGISQLNIRLSLCLFLACAVAPLAVAQRAAAEGPVQVTVLVAALPQEGAGSSALERVLVRAMSVEMVRAGLQPMAVLPERTEAERAGAPADSLTPANLSEAELVALAGRRGADFLLVASYSVKGRQAALIFRFHDVSADRVLAVGEVSSRIDLALDDAVNFVMEALAPRVGARAAEVARVRAAEASRRRAEEAAARQAAEEVARRHEEEARVAAAERQVPENETTEGPHATPPAAQGRFRPWELSLGFAPFLPLGALGEYFTLGYAPLLGFSYRFDAAFGTLGVGVHTGAMYLQPGVRDEAAYMRWLIPLGLDLRYSLPEGRRFTLFAQLSGGAAYRLPDSFGAESGVSAHLSTVLPFAKGGIGVILAVSEGFGLALDAQYHAYFYVYADGGQSGALAVEVLSGLLPSLNVFVRL